MRIITPAASALAAALYVGYLASPAAALDATVTITAKPKPAIGAPGPQLGTGLVSIFVAGAVVYLMRRRKTERE
jgi:hypothetical protein